MKTLGQRVDELIQRHKREAHLQAQDEGGNPSIFEKKLGEFIVKLEQLLDEYEF